MPRKHEFAIGECMTQGLYGLLEALIRVRFAQSKAEQLQSINIELDVLRYQTRLLFDFKVLPLGQYEFASRAINNIGTDLGGWIKQQARSVGT